MAGTYKYFYVPNMIFLKLNYDFAGYQTLEDFNKNVTAPAATTPQSPYLGYFSDLQFKLNYVFSPNASNPGAGTNYTLDYSQFVNMAIGNPNANEVGGAALNPAAIALWDRYDIFNLGKIISSNRQPNLHLVHSVSLANLKLFYFDVGVNDDFLLTNPNTQLHNNLTAAGIVHCT
jgi:hypothetical protein